MTGTRSTRSHEATRKWDKIYETIVFKRPSIRQRRRVSLRDRNKLSPGGEGFAVQVGDNQARGRAWQAPWLDKMEQRVKVDKKGSVPVGDSRRRPYVESSVNMPRVPTGVLKGTEDRIVTGTE